MNLLRQGSGKGTIARARNLLKQYAITVSEKMQLDILFPSTTRLKKHEI